MSFLRAAFSPFPRNRDSFLVPIIGHATISAINYEETELCGLSLRMLVEYRMTRRCGSAFYRIKFVCCPLRELKSRYLSLHGAAGGETFISYHINMNVHIQV